MAKNLQAKLPHGDTIRLFDINTAAMEKLAQEMKARQPGGAAVELAQDAAQASREAVRTQIPLVRDLTDDSNHSVNDDTCSIYDLSWGWLLLAFP